MPSRANGSRWPRSQRSRPAGDPRKPPFATSLALSGPSSSRLRTSRAAPSEARHAYGGTMPGRGRSSSTGYRTSRLDTQRNPCSRSTEYTSLR